MRKFQKQAGGYLGGGKPGIKVKFSASVGCTSTTEPPTRENKAGRMWTKKFFHLHLDGRDSNNFNNLVDRDLDGKYPPPLI